MNQFRRIAQRVQDQFANPQTRMLMFFGIEGMLFQFVTSMAAANGFGTNLYATNLGATDNQIGMIQLVASLAALALLLPVGVVSDRMKNAKTVPVALMALMGVMYFFYGTVPAMGERRMTFFFVFLAITAGMQSTYNSIWQAFFGDVTPMEQRNRVYAFRNRFVYIIATAAPILCGMLLTAMPDSESKLTVLRVFYYLCGVLALTNAWVISRIPGGRRSPEMLAQTPKISPKAIGSVLGGLFRDRKFLVYFGSVMFFYCSWHFDWSMWYIGQIQYVKMTEADLSLYNALACLGQLLVMGFFVRMVEKKGTMFTFLIALVSLALCPMVMFASLAAAPMGYGPITMIVLATVVFSPQCAVNLCLVQMLLDAIPEKNRSLIVSLNMMFVTLSNAFVPFLGVQLYTALGSDLRAYKLFMLTALIFRTTTLVIFVLRYLAGRRVKN